jgi:hypothetical protein
MPKCISKYTLTLSNLSGDALMQNPQYIEWCKLGGGVVGNVRSLLSYEYKQYSKLGDIRLEDDIYLAGFEQWGNRDEAMMSMSQECFKKYFIPI